MISAKKLSVLFFFFLFGIGVFAAGSCTSASWAPSTINTPTYSNSGSSYKISYQTFKWNSSSADSFSRLEFGLARYQYEVRRFLNKWNFFDPVSGKPTDGIYWTNLPNPSQSPNATQGASEESGSLVYGPDEEMQINSRTAKIVPNVLYYVQAKYKRLFPSASMQVDTESEYCGGVYPLCVGFNWCTMSTGRISS